MITAEPDSFLYEVCREVEALAPGDCFTMEMRDLRSVGSYDHKGAHFSPADRVLENIVGSANTHKYRIDGQRVTFVRLEEKGNGYVSPDRRVKYEDYPVIL